MKSKVSRVTAAVAVMAALGGTAACGGGDDKGGKPAKAATATATASGKASGPAKDDGDAKDADGAKDTGAPEKSATAGAPAALSRAQLDKAALADGEVKGYTVDRTPASDISLDSVPATPAACQPVADMFLFTTRPTAHAGVGRGFTTKDDLDASVTSLALLSYRSGEADEVLAGLRKAADTCTSYKHTGYRYSEVKPLKDPHLGDESVAYRLKASIEDTEVPTTFTVVRVGTVVVSFTSMNMLDPDKVKVPTEIVEKQLAKVEKAVG
ncbi:hypothetical protein ACIPJS_31380 [Streptomyces sp. NPDC086783]|uniref:hypothetical protein n=1 Tax=Streptomyces sp. NPDC086783 TaxID=3365758 RepID=UPI003800B1F8